VSASFKVWGDYSLEKVKELWEGEMPSRDLRDIYDEGYNLKHVCSLDTGDDCENGLDMFCYVFTHTDYPNTGGSCELCGWILQGAPAGTRATISIRVPRGIPEAYATHREKVLADLFKVFPNDFDDDFDFDDADFD